MKSSTIALRAGSASSAPATATWTIASIASPGAAPLRPRAVGTDPDPIAIGSRPPGRAAPRRPGRPNSRIGSTIGGYRLERRLGSGGTSVVYRAVDVVTGAATAMKVMRRQLVGDRDMTDRFEQEAELLSHIDHPGLPGFVGRGRTTDGAPYLVMELLGGQTLADRLDIGPMAVADVLDIAGQAATTLGALHAVGVVHCDLKPDNVLLVPDAVQPSRYRVVLIDLGVAVVRAGAGRAGAPSHRRVIGTPPYMAPEQARLAAELDARTDIYGFACLVHEMLCGETPFAGNIAEVLSAHQSSTPPRVSERRGDVPAALDLLLVTMLAKDPASRPPTMAAVRVGLDQAAAAG